MKYSIAYILTVICSALLLPVQGAEAGCSPILLDLKQNGIKLGKPGVAVKFDIDCDGHRENMQWVIANGDEAFLAMDRNGNGLIDDGSELFGVGTPLEFEGRKARDGYEALGQYDLEALGGNGDGKIDQQDAVWERLILWLDADANAASNSREILTLQSQSILSLGLNVKKSRQQDRAGNSLALWSWAEVDKKRKRMRMVDVFFAIVEEN